MVSISSITLLSSLFLSLCNSIFVEISLFSNNESKKLKLLCGLPAQNLNPDKSKHTILWHGSRFGDEEQQKLSEMLPTDTLIPNLSINSSKRHLCYLLAETDSSYDTVIPRKRIQRNSLESFPAKNGICPLGHRMDGNRCYFEDSEHSAITQSPPWILIYSMIGVIIVGIWIVIIVLLVRYCRELYQADTEQLERAETKADSRWPNKLWQRIFGKDDDDALYESISESNEPGEPIYAEIGDYDDIYEVPRKPSDPPIYVDIVPEPPPKRRRHSSPATGQRSMDSDLYEIPTEIPSEDQYEVPITKSRSENSYEVPITKRRSENSYEVPITKRRSENSYEVPITKRRNENSYEVPITKRRSENSYEVPITKRRSENSYEVPITKGSDPLYDDIRIADDEDRYDDVQHASNERNYAKGEEDNRHLPTTISKGFKPGTSSRKGARKTSSGSMYKAHRPSHESQKKKMSEEGMAKIPEETENIYDVPALG